MEESGQKNIYVDAHVQPIKGSKIKRGTRVQFVNQDLNEAIKEMKQSIRKKSKTNLQGYSTNKNQYNYERELNNPQNSDRNPSNSRILFTETYKKKVQQRLSEIEDRKKELTAQSLEKQMRARLLRKIEENVKLKQKMDILKEIQERRQLLLTEKSQREKRIRQQQQLLHQSSRVNAEMTRKTRKKTIKRELKDSRCIQQESLKDHRFKNYLTQKQKQEKNVLLHYRHQFLIRNKSSQGLRDSILSSRTHSLSRGIKTSHISIKNKERILDEDEKLIIEQYKSKEEGEGEAKAEQKITQKKYNLKVRRNSKGNENNEVAKPHQSEIINEGNNQQTN